MKFFILNDIHIGVKNDAEYMLDHQAKFYNEVFFPYIEQNQIVNGMVLGDVFDRRKYINFESLYKARQILFNPLRDKNISVDVIPGNHCLYKRNVNDINSLELLLSEYTNINQIHNPTIKEYDGLKFMFLPWFHNSHHNDTMDFIANNDADLVLAHLELSGFEMQKGLPNNDGIAGTFLERFPMVLSGHYHSKSSRDNIHYLGTQYEITWADADEKKGFHVFDTETKQLTFVENPNRLHEKIFYNDETTDYVNMDCSVYKGKIVKLFVEKRIDQLKYENFLDKMYKQDMIDFSIIEDISSFHETNVETVSLSTKDLINEYVDNVQTNYDKTRIKTILNKLYLEALMEN